MSWVFVGLLAGAVLVLIGAEWPRLSERFGLDERLEARERKARAERKAKLHIVKDMGIALAEARRMNLSLPGLALAQQLYVALMAQGKGRKGTQSLILALASLSNVEWRAGSAAS